MVREAENVRGASGQFLKFHTSPQPALLRPPSTFLTRVNHGQPVVSSGNSQTLQNECTRRNSSSKARSPEGFTKYALAPSS
jgi:hypothetical protein